MTDEDKLLLEIDSYTTLVMAWARAVGGDDRELEKRAAAALLKRCGNRS
jgi:hypothetical protein